jgi:hypothetical protein
LHPNWLLDRIKQLLRVLEENEELENDLNSIMKVPGLIKDDKGTDYIDILPSDKED